MLKRIVIPRPHVPFGPEGLSDDEADVHYLREVVKKIDEGYARVGGSNVTATIRKLISDAADAIEAHDHHARCCPEHGTHAMPHRGCILR